MSDSKKDAVFENTDIKVNPKGNASRKVKFKIPEHLTEDFWKNVTPQHLKDKLRSIKDINEVRGDNKQNMFHLLVQHGQYPEMIPLLIDAGVDYKKADSAHFPLHYATMKPEETQAYAFTQELLKRVSLDIDIKGLIYEETPLIAASYFRAGTKVIHLLLEKGADPNAQTKDKNTALMTSSFPNIYNGMSFINPATIQLLLDYKADITMVNKEGRTALDYMEENEDFKKTKLFKDLSTRFF